MSASVRVLCVCGHVCAYTMLKFVHVKTLSVCAHSRGLERPGCRTGEAGLAFQMEYAIL